MNVKQAKNHEFSYGLVTESHIMMNLWAGDASAPGMREWLGEYEPVGTVEASYEWFSYEPES